MGSKSKYTILDSPELRNNKVACLTLDVEQDFGDLLQKPSYEGLEHIPELVELFKERGIPLTCFVQGSLFETHPEKIQELAQLDVEFELHSYSHPGPKDMDTEKEIERGKEAYQRFFGKFPLGYRSPLGFINNGDYKTLASEEFRFDSSVFPSIRPGTFNNLGQPTKPHILNASGIVEFPFTVFSSIVRVPIALSYIKLLGKPYLYALRHSRLPDLIVFDFHLHDLFELDSSKNIALERFSLPYSWIFGKIYKNSTNGLATLDELVSMLQAKGYSFQKLRNVYESICR